MAYSSRRRPRLRGRGGAALQQLLRGDVAHGLRVGHGDQDASQVRRGHVPGGGAVDRAQQREEERLAVGDDAAEVAEEKDAVRRRLVTLGGQREEVCETVGRESGLDRGNGFRSEGGLRERAGERIPCVRGEMWRSRSRKQGEATWWTGPSGTRRCTNLVAEN